MLRDLNSYIYNSRNYIGLLNILSANHYFPRIYNSSNYIGLLNSTQSKQRSFIYNSRNYMGLLNLKKRDNLHVKSTIVEII